MIVTILTLSFFRLRAIFLLFRHLYFYLFLFIVRRLLFAGIVRNSIGNQLFQRSHIGLLINTAHDRLPNDVALTVHNIGCGESHDAQCKLAGLAVRIKVDIAEGCAC